MKVCEYYDLVSLPLLTKQTLTISTVTDQLMWI